MKLYKCIVIDDDSYAIEGLKNYISSIPNLVLQKYYTDPVQALIEIKANEPVDLILLDITMPKINGLELSHEIRDKTTKLIFTTSHAQYGYEAFEASADAYLLKPYTLSKFASTISKMFPKIAGVSTPSYSEENFFFVKDKNEDLKIVKIRYREIVAVESQQNYILIHTLSKKVLTYMSLTEIAIFFNSLSNFVQFQRSFIVNKDHIESINGNTIKMANNIQITVGNYYRKDFNNFLNKNLLKTRRRD